MACKAAQQRITQVWQETNANPGVQVANPNGASYIALGSLDTVGAVQISCNRPQASGFSNFVVAAGAPFVGYIEGPFLVLPIYYNAFSASQPLVLDMLIFEDLPPVPVGARAPLLLSVTATGASFATGFGGLSANVRGRTRVTAAIRNVSATGTGDDFDVNGYQLAAPAVPLSGTTTPATATNAQVQSGSYTNVLTTQVHQFFPTISPPSGDYPGVDSLDYVEIGDVTAAQLGQYSLIIQAWD